MKHFSVTFGVQLSIRPLTTRIQGYKDTRIQGYKSDNYFIEFTIVIFLKQYMLHTSNYLQKCTRDKIEIV